MNFKTKRLSYGLYLRYRDAIVLQVTGMMDIPFAGRKWWMPAHFKAAPKPESPEDLA